MVSIKEMKQVITNSGLSVAGLLERKDVEERYAEALKASKKKSKRLAKAVERGPEGPTTGQASFFAGKSGRAVNDFLSKPDTAGLPRNPGGLPTVIQTPEQLQQLISMIGPEEFERMTAHIPGPPPGWKPGDEDVPSAAQQATRADIKRATDLAEAGDYEGGIRILTPIIDRLDTENAPAEVPAPSGFAGSGQNLTFTSMSLSAELIAALMERAQMYSANKEHDKAYADATTLVRYVPMVLQAGHHDRAADFLSFRAKVATIGGNFASALADAKVGMDLKVDRTTWCDFLTLFQEAKVMELVQDVLAQPTRTRPHFPDAAARREFQKAALIGPFATKRLTGCEVCGKKEELMFCSGCEQVCYCSREHQKADWKRHRGACKSWQQDPNNPHSFFRETRAELLSEVAGKGFKLASHPVNLDATLLDPKTGELYDLVSNRRVFCEDDRPPNDLPILP